MQGFRSWLKENNYDWEDPKLSLGYIKIGQVNLKTSFQKNEFTDIYEDMKNNLNIRNITVTDKENVSNDFPYTLESSDWKLIQLKELKRGYESRSMR